MSCPYVNRLGKYLFFTIVFCLFRFCFFNNYFRLCIKKNKKGFLVERNLCCFPLVYYVN